MAVNNEYGQLFCEAVDLIVEQRLKAVQFDSTILCTIIDDSDKDAGIYRVKTPDGTAAFLAYSEKTNYSNGNNVYVQIPNGDMNEQKFIIAKKTDNTNIPLSYKPPFASFINITGNLVSNINGVKAGLIANEQNSESNKNAEAITIWGYNIDHSKSEIGEPFAKYTRLGIQAQFCSWLDGLKVKSGTYGLRLRVEVEKTDSADIESDSNVEENPNPLEYVDFILNTNDMIGDPYNFDTYYQQEKVFSIEDFYSIKRMELQFYQNKDFYNQNNELIKVLENPNLFVKDVIISLGYDVNEFEDDEVRIFSLDSPKYDTTADPPENNHKRLQLRWIHKFEDGTVRVVTEEDELDYKITWYKYRLGTYSHTPTSGADWKQMSDQYSDIRIKKIIAEDPYIDPPNKYNILDEEWMEYNQSAEPGLYRLPSLNKTWLIPDITLAEESVKVVLDYLPTDITQNGEKHLVSNRLDFTNRKEVVSKPTVDAVTALQIVCEDESNGNYMIYNQGNELLDSSQGTEEKVFTAYFKGAPLLNAEYIEWIIPSKNSMIKIDQGFLGALIPEEIENKKEFAEINNNAIDEAGRYHIYRFGRPDNKYSIDHANTQKYKIKSYYTPEYNDNTIQCRIVKDKITYTATKSLVFGPSGTSGSDHTLIIDFDEENVNAIDIGHPDKTYYNIIARLYDYSGKEVEFAGVDCNIEWSWYKKHGVGVEEGLKGYYEELDGLYQPNDSYVNKKCISILKDKITINDLYILQAKLTWRGDQNLIAYFPIPLRKYLSITQENIIDSNGLIIGTQETKEEYGYISGATQVIYKSDGIPYYNKTPYQIYKTKFIHKVEENTTASSQVQGPWQQDLSLAGPVGNVTWSILKTETDEGVDKFYPTIDKNICLSPLPLYIEDNPLCGVQCRLDGEVIWTQPILIVLNRYPNGAVNRWDGTGLKINEEDGTIIGTAFAAGKKVKSDDGTMTFSGVMLGDWATGAKGDVEESIGAETGVYGFHFGEMSYALKENGSMFIGKSGRGRIYFDGEEGKIYSGNYYLDEEQGIEAKNGMLIDLSNGHIDAYNFRLTSSSIYMDSATNTFEFDVAEGGHFAIEGSKKDLLYFSSADSYIQSNNFSNSSETGMRIDLDEGNITAYDFLLEAGTGSDKIIIDSDTSNDFPLKIGNDFKVTWDGSLYANNAFLQGVLKSTVGRLGGWYIGEKTLEGGGTYTETLDENGYITKITPSGSKIILNSSDASIAGGILKSTDNLPVFLDGVLSVSSGQKSYDASAGTYGFIGAMGSNMGTVADTDSDGVGLWAAKDGNKKSVVKATTSNAGLAFSSYSIWIESDGIHFSTGGDPEKQYGIYARFG